MNFAAFDLLTGEPTKNQRSQSPSSNEANLSPKQFSPSNSASSNSSSSSSDWSYSSLFDRLLADLLSQSAGRSSVTAASSAVAASSGLVSTLSLLRPLFLGQKDEKLRGSIFVGSQPLIQPQQPSQIQSATIEEESDESDTEADEEKFSGSASAVAAAVSAVAPSASSSPASQLPLIDARPVDVFSDLSPNQRNSFLHWRRTLNSWRGLVDSAASSESASADSKSVGVAGANNSLLADYLGIYLLSVFGAASNRSTCLAALNSIIELSAITTLRFTILHFCKFLHAPLQIQMPANNGHHQAFQSHSSADSADSMISLLSSHFQSTDFLPFTVNPFVVNQLIHRFDLRPSILRTFQAILLDSPVSLLVSSAPPSTRPSDSIPTSFFQFSDTPIFPRVVANFSSIPSAVPANSPNSAAAASTPPVAYSWFCWLNVDSFPEGSNNIFRFFNDGGYGIQVFGKGSQISVRVLPNTNESFTIKNFQFEFGRWCCIAIVHKPVKLEDAILLDTKTGNIFSSSQSQQSAFPAGQLPSVKSKSASQSKTDISSSSRSPLLPGHLSFYFNGDHISTANISFPAMATGDALQCTIGGFQGKMNGFYWFADSLNQSAAFSLYKLGPNEFANPAFHLVNNGIVAVFPPAPCITAAANSSGSNNPETENRPIPVSHRLVLRLLLAQLPSSTTREFCLSSPWPENSIGQSKCDSHTVRLDGIRTISRRSNSQLFADSGGLKYLLLSVSPQLLGSPYDSDQDFYELLNLISRLVIQNQHFAHQLMEIGAAPIKKLLFDKLKRKQKTRLTLVAVKELILAVRAVDSTMDKYHFISFLSSLLMDFTFWRSTSDELLIDCAKFLFSLIQSTPNLFVLSALIGVPRIFDNLRCIQNKLFDPTGAQNDNEIDFAANSSNSTLIARYFTLIVLIARHSLGQAAGAFIPVPADHYENYILLPAVHFIEQIEMNLSPKLYNLAIYSLHLLLTLINLQFSRSIACLFDRQSHYLFLRFLSARNFEIRILALKLIAFYNNHITNIERSKRPEVSLLQSDLATGVRDALTAAGKLNLSDHEQFFGVLMGQMPDVSDSLSRFDISEFLVSSDSSSIRPSVAASSALFSLDSANSFSHANFLSCRLELAVNASTAVQSKVLLDILTLLRTNPANVEILASLFWQRLLLPFISFHQPVNPEPVDELSGAGPTSDATPRTVDLLVYQLLNLVSGHCLINEPKGWQVLDQLFWCLQQFQSNSNSHSSSSTSPSAWRVLMSIFARMLNSQHRAIKSLSFTKSKNSTSEFSDFQLSNIKRNFAAVLELIENSMFHWELSFLADPISDSFNKSSIAIPTDSTAAVSVPDEELFSAPGEIGFRPETSSEVNANAEVEDFVFIGESPVVKQSPADFARIRSRTISEPLTQDEFDVFSLSLISTVEHFPLPDRRQDILRLMFRYLLIILPHPLCGSLTEIICDQLIHLFLVRINDANPKNSRLVALSLSLLKSSMEAFMRREDQERVEIVKKTIGKLYETWGEKIFTDIQSNTGTISNALAISIAGVMAATPKAGKKTILATPTASVNRPSSTNQNSNSPDLLTIDMLNNEDSAISTSSSLVPSTGSEFPSDSQSSMIDFSSSILNSFNSTFADSTEVLRPPIANADEELKKGRALSVASTQASNQSKSLNSPDFLTSGLGFGNFSAASSIGGNSVGSLIQPVLPPLSNSESPTEQALYHLYAGDGRQIIQQTQLVFAQHEQRFAFLAGVRAKKISASISDYNKRKKINESVRERKFVVDSQVSLSKSSRAPFLLEFYQMKKNSPAVRISIREQENLNRVQKILKQFRIQHTNSRPLPIPISREFFRLPNQLFDGPFAKKTSPLNISFSNLLEFWKLDSTESPTRQRRLLKKNYSGSSHLSAVHIQSASFNAQQQKKLAELLNVQIPLANAEESGVSVESDAKELNSEAENKATSNAENKKNQVEPDENEETSDPINGGIESGEFDDSADHSHSDSIGGKLLCSHFAVMITPTRKYFGTVRINSTEFLFDGAEDLKVEERTSKRGHGELTDSIRQNKEKKIRWNLKQIRMVLPRCYLLRESALEIFLANFKNYFFNFTPIDVEMMNLDESIKYEKPNPPVERTETENTKRLKSGREQRNEVYKLMCSLLPDMLYELSAGRRLLKSGIMKRWQRGEISNFDYLMHLNTIAGRSYNDINQYPVFPWILTDYKSKSLNLDDPNIYRDLSKPIGALNPDRFAIYKERFETFEEDAKSQGSAFSFPGFLYGSHYSSAGIALHYLIRLEPFTSLAVSLQGGRFDLADRLFDSISLVWDLSLNNIADVKELTPEFFYFPDFLRNLNQLDLGTKQDNQRLGDVVLPPWANGSPEEFIRLHRAALESEYVSQHLNDWIDLIFGCKSRGKAAVEADNVFFYLTYSGSVDIDSIENPALKKATEDQIAHFGQTPIQLLSSPHPKRFSAAERAKFAAPAIKLPIAPISTFVPQLICWYGPNSFHETKVAAFNAIFAQPNLALARKPIQSGEFEPFQTMISAVPTAICYSNHEVLVTVSPLFDIQTHTLSQFLASTPVPLFVSDLGLGNSKPNEPGIEEESGDVEVVEKPNESSILHSRLMREIGDSVNPNNSSLAVSAAEFAPGTILSSRPVKPICSHYFPPAEIPSPPASAINESSFATLFRRSSAGSAVSVAAKNAKFLFSGGYADGALKCHSLVHFRPPSLADLDSTAAQNATVYHSLAAQEYSHSRSRPSSPSFATLDSKPLSSVSAHRQPITAIHLSHVHSLLLTGDSSGSLCFWRVFTEIHERHRPPLPSSPLAHFNLHQGKIISLDTNPIIGLAIALSRDAGDSRGCQLSLFATRGGSAKFIREIFVSDPAVDFRLCALTPNGSIAIHGIHYGEPKLWLFSMNGSTIKSRACDEIYHCLTSVSSNQKLVDPTEGFLIAAGRRGQIHFLEPASLQPIQSFFTDQRFPGYFLHPREESSESSNFVDEKSSEQIPSVKDLWNGEIQENNSPAVDIVAELNFELTNHSEATRKSYSSSSSSSSSVYTDPSIDPPIGVCAIDISPSQKYFTVSVYPNPAIVQAAAANGEFPPSWAPRLLLFPVPHSTAPLNSFFTPSFTSSIDSVRAALDPNYALVNANGEPTSALAAASSSGNGIDRLKDAGLKAGKQIGKKVLGVFGNIFGKKKEEK